MLRIDGNYVSEIILNGLSNDIKTLHPRMAVLYAGNNPSTLSYIKSKTKKAEKHNIIIDVKSMPENVSAVEFYEQLTILSNDNSIDGIIVEKPLPAQIDIKKCALLINPEKDIDCLSPYNNGKLITDDFIIAPSTAMAVINLLKISKIDYEGKYVVIIGRSEIVGKPLSLLFLSKTIGNASVNVLHSRSNDIKSYTKNADIIVAALGKPHFLTKDYIGNNKPVIVDVGINYYEGKITGDVHEDVYTLSSAYTPVPGGVGPVTVATLFENLLKLKKKNV